MIERLKKPIVGWKQVETDDGCQAIAKLLVPAGARVRGPEIFSDDDARWDRPLKFLGREYRRQCTEQSHYVDTKFRADRAVVLSIVPLDVEDTLPEGGLYRSGYWSMFLYKKGAKVTSQVDATGKKLINTGPFNTNPDTECGSGIHFFLTRREAENY